MEVFRKYFEKEAPTSLVSFYETVWENVVIRQLARTHLSRFHEEFQSF
jgi:hypothetical protein